MPIINRFADFHDDIVAWRRDLHRHPELLYDVPRTAGFVEERLKAFGVDEVVTGLGRIGVVGVIRGKKTDSGRAIGLRADMDALPIHETTGAPYQSDTPGKMHACGHDGHTAMLLGAARYLAETRNFDGTAVVIFQPAEEGGGGGREMVADGLMERFAINEVYGMHNMPGIPVGQFAIRPGPIMAATDEITIRISGRGGHAARPHLAVDPVLVGAEIVQAAQSIVARNINPTEPAVLSITTFHSGDTMNVIADDAEMHGTARSFSHATRDILEQRLREIVAGVAAAHGATAEVEYFRNYPITRNHPDQTDFAAKVAAKVVPADRVETETPALMVGEDFSYMLEARPGAFIFLGNGDSAALHRSDYDFNDDAIPIGCSYWATLVETALPAD